MNTSNWSTIESYTCRNVAVSIKVSPDHKIYRVEGHTGPMAMCGTKPLRTLTANTKDTARAYASRMYEELKQRTLAVA